MKIKNGCFCLDEQIAIPKAIKDTEMEDIHSTHSGKDLARAKHLKAIYATQYPSKS